MSPAAPAENLLASLQLAVQDVVRDLVKSLRESVPLAPTVDAELRGKIVALRLKVRGGMAVMTAAIPAEALLTKEGRAEVVAKFRAPLSQLTFAWGCGWEDHKRISEQVAKKDAADAAAAAEPAPS